MLSLLINACNNTRDMVASTKIIFLFEFTYNYEKLIGILFNRIDLLLGRNMTGVIKTKYYIASHT